MGGNACLRVDTGYLPFIWKNQEFKLFNQLGFKLNNSIRIQAKQFEGFARDPLHARLIQSARDKTCCRHISSVQIVLTHRRRCAQRMNQPVYTVAFCWTAYSFTFQLVSIIFND